MPPPPPLPGTGPSPLRTPAQRRRTGLLYGLSAYGLWGFLPLYFLALAPANAFEIVAWRVLFSILFCALVISVTNKWRALVDLLRRPRVVLTLGLAGILIFVNWQTYVYATMEGHVVEAALGYFINPIVTILLGVIVQREHMRPTQWVAVGVSLIAVTVLTVGYGAPPWIALVLAFSFGLYGLIKKRVGPSVDALSGLTVETLLLAPIAIIQLVFVGATVGVTFGTVSIWHSLLLLSAGVVTAVPLLLFAAAARRIPLIYLGFIQYLTPILQFVVGVSILHEPMPFERWVGFGLVWIALLILTTDMIIAGRGPRRAALQPV
jgi:chloramphenicol-sensitive protein RarD